MRLYRFQKSSFTGGIFTRDGMVISFAPVLKRYLMRGMPWETARDILEKENIKLEEVEVDVGFGMDKGGVK